MKHVSLSIVYLLCSIFIISAEAQNAHRFTEGLISGTSYRYGREAIYTDQLAYQLSAGTLKTPKPGQTLFTNDKGTPVTWKTIKADSTGTFTDNENSGGYLYLTYHSTNEQVALLNITGNGMVYFNGEPHAGDIYDSKWMYIPVKIKKGLNELYIRAPRYMYSGIAAKLEFPDKPVVLSIEDMTLPNILLGQENKGLWGGIVVINATSKPLVNMVAQTMVEGKQINIALPTIPALTFRKVGVKFDGSGVGKKGTYDCRITLLQKGKAVDEKVIQVEAVNTSDYYSCTFISEIDGSVQYYSVCPQSKADRKPALFLSVHGAGVEAIGQARAYEHKDWGVLVAPTNRRPRGFNWEDWGRLDALEVLGIAQKQFNPDPERLYLTGHSMGGHGTWHLGATFPGKWAAIAPCAGYPTLAGYGSADGKIPVAGQTETEKALLQASNGSNVMELARNYNAGGVYIHHGDSDKVVSVDYARQMRKILAEFHKDFSYYEYPGGSHWFSNQSVDWPPIFDYFKWHTIKPDSIVNNIDFTTANPAVSPSYYWASILQQQQALNYSRIRLIRDPKLNAISGETENVSILGLSVASFKTGDEVLFNIDKQSIRYTIKANQSTVYLYNKGQWQLGGQPDLAQKGTVRNGTFKEPFNYRMVYVYSTSGTEQENNWSYNKARYDAETWYYRGNGAVDMVADKDFNPASYPDRGIVIYGNATTNSAWAKLLSGCPIQVQRGSMKIGGKQLQGSDYGAYFMWPRHDSKKASVAVITGTGLTGMGAANANQYFAGASGFPDYMVFSADMLKDGASGVKFAGFYGNDWKISE